MISSAATFSLHQNDWDLIPPSAPMLAQSLTTPVERSFKAGSHEEGRFSSTGKPLLQEEASKKKVFEGTWLFQEFLEEMKGARRAHFSLRDMQGNLVSPTLEGGANSPLLKALAQWSGKGVPQEAFSEFDLSRPVSVLQMLILGELMNPLTPEEEGLVAELQRENPSIFETENPSISLLEDHKVETSWKVRIATLGVFKVSLTTTLSPQGGQRPCNIEMKRTSTFLHGDRGNPGLLARLVRAIWDFFFRNLIKNPQKQARAPLVPEIRV